MAAVGAASAFQLGACSRCPGFGGSLASQGGLRLVYGVQVEADLDPSIQGEERRRRIDAAMQQAHMIAVRRLEALEEEHRVQIDGNTLIVDLYGGGPHTTARRLFERQGRLELTFVDDQERDFYEKLRPFTANEPRVGITDEQASFYLHAIDAPGDDMVQRTGEELLKRFLDRARKAGVEPPANRKLGFEKSPPPRGENGGSWRTYLLHSEPIVTGENVTDANVAYSEEGYDAGRPYVSLVFNQPGRDLFARATSANVGKRLAIVLDSRVSSAPVIREPITGGRAQISLGSLMSRDELVQQARDLVVVLRAGALPAPFVLLEETMIGPARGSGGE